MIRVHEVCEDHNLKDKVIRIYLKHHNEFFCVESGYGYDHMQSLSYGLKLAPCNIWKANKVEVALTVEWIDKA